MEWSVITYYRARILELSPYADGRVVFGVPLEISTQYASVQLSTSGPDDSLYVWG